MHTTDHQVLADLNRHYVRAALESDVRWYADNLAEDYVTTNPDGSVMDRAMFLARMARPYPGSAAEAVDVNVRVLGEFAIVHAGFRDVGLQGELRSGRYTDIYARRGGRWLCVAAHFTRLDGRDPKAG